MSSILNPGAGAPEHSPDKPEAESQEGKEGREIYSHEELKELAESRIQQVDKIVKDDQSESLDRLQQLNQQLTESERLQVEQEAGAVDQLGEINSEIGMLGEETKQRLRTLASPESSRAVSTEVNRELLEQYSQYEPYGPSIGEVMISDKKTGQPVKAEVHVTDRRGVLDTEPNNLIYTILVDNEMVGIAYLRDDIASNKEYAKPQSHDAEHYYGEDREHKNPNKVFIEFMGSSLAPDYGGPVSIPGNERYKGIGTALYQIAVERSFQIGGEGMVQGQAAWQSLPAHEHFGFQGQDVYMNDGTLHHEGQKIHENLAKSRLNSANFFKKAGRNNEQIAQSLVDVGLGDLKEDDYAYFYLPQSIIDREKGRIDKDPRLKANKATIDALLEKHKLLREQQYKKQEADRLVEGYQKEEVTPNWEQLKKIAELYEQGADPDKSKLYYAKTIEAYGEPGLHHSHFAELGEFNWKIGNVDAAHEWYKRAAADAMKRGEHDQAREYYIQAGDEASARKDYRDY